METKLIPSENSNPFSDSPLARTIGFAQPWNSSHSSQANFEEVVKKSERSAILVSNFTGTEPAEQAGIFGIYVCNSQMLLHLDS